MMLIAATRPSTVRRRVFGNRCGRSLNSGVDSSGLFSSLMLKPIYRRKILLKLMRGDTAKPFEMTYMQSFQTESCKIREIEIENRNAKSQRASIQVYDQHMHAKIRKGERKKHNSPFQRRRNEVERGPPFVISPTDRVPRLSPPS